MLFVDPKAILEVFDGFFGVDSRALFEHHSLTLESVLKAAVGQSPRADCAAAAVRVAAAVRIAAFRCEVAATSAKFQVG